MHTPILENLKKELKKQDKLIILLLEMSHDEITNSFVYAELYEAAERARIRAKNERNREFSL